MAYLRLLILQNKQNLTIRYKLSVPVLQNRPINLLIQHTLLIIWVIKL